MHSHLLLLPSQEIDLLDAEWDFGGKFYKEHAIYGVDAGGDVAFWSFTSDGKRSRGVLQRAGCPPRSHRLRGRNASRPCPNDLLARNRRHYALGRKSKTKKGWNRFTEHTYSKEISESKVGR